MIAAEGLAPDRLVDPRQLATVQHIKRARLQKRTQWTRLPLYAKQAAIVDDPARFTICEASTKAGKTMSHVEWLLEQAANRGEGDWWWVAPYNGTAAIAYRRAQDRLRGYLGTGGERKRVAAAVPFEKHDTDRWVQFRGARIWFKSAEKPDALYGEDVYAAVVDEITRCREESWHAIYTTLTATKGRAKLIGNVKGRRNFAFQLARKAEAGEAGWGHHKLTALDAVEGGVLDREIIEGARKHLPDSVFRELYLAEPSDDEGNPFGFDAIRACVTEVYSTAPVAVWGWDLAKSSDWTWGVALDAQGRMVASERWQAPWETTIERIVALTAGAPALVDSTGVGDPVLEALQKRGGNFEGFKFSSMSKQQLMEGLAVAIQRHEVTIADPLLASELESFEYEYTRTGARYSAPEGLHDDGVCALALAVAHKARSWVPVVMPLGETQPSAWGGS